MRIVRTILALISFIALVPASAQVWGGIGTVGGGASGGVRPDPSPYDPVQPFPGGPVQDQARREVYVGQYFRDQDINLISLLRLQQGGLQGARIDTVEIAVDDGNGISSVGLIVNGMMDDQTSAYSSFLTLRPRRDVYVGQNLSDLRLRIRGKIFIERIAVSLQEPWQNPGNPGYPGYPGNPGNPGGGQQQISLPGYVDQTFYGQGSVDIARATNLMAYRGYQIVAIRIYGESIDNSFSRASLLVNGSIDGQVLLSPGNQMYEISPRGSYIVGRNLNSLNLLVDGAHISRVEVRLVRF